MTVGFQRRDYYQLLQVDPEAHPEIVRAAFRTLLKVLRQHPDLGGDEARARLLIEAYETLSDPHRRVAYNLWLKSHAAPPSPGLPDDIRGFVKDTLAGYVEAPAAPFASRFDLVLEAPAPGNELVYAKSFARLARGDWPTALTLCRAVGVGNTGLLPSTTVILLVSPRVEQMDELLAETSHHCAHWAWNRRFIAVMSYPPVSLAPGAGRFSPPSLKRLDRACPRRRLG
jgi:hypothetical protein